MLTLNETHVAAASIALADAFFRDPLFIYLFPDSKTRHGYTRHIFELQVQQGFLAEGVFATSKNLEGVSVLLSSKSINPGLLTFLKIGGLKILRNIPISALGRLIQVERVLSSLRQRNTPASFVYLSLIGVQPVYQGQGHAKKLLTELLAALEVQKMPCYLETENERNVSLYKFFGFSLLEKIKLTNNLYCWAMLKT